MTRLRELLFYWFRQAKRLVHMLEALAFLILAFIGACVSFSEWQRYRHTPGRWELVAFALVASFTVLLVMFGLYSFVKARSVR